MKVEKIIQYTHAYKDHIASLKELPNLHRYDALYHWQQNWNIDDLSFSSMYEKSLHSKISMILWGGSRDSAKSVMLDMIKHNEQFIKHAFQDLFNEEKDLALRMNRFIYHLDEMLLLLQEKDRKQNTHYHDKHMVCFYLAMQYPDKYCLWDYASFYPTMMLLESRNIPSEVETERYYKSLRGIYQIVKKDTETMALFNYLLASTEIKVIPELFLMNDWMDFVSKQKK